MRLAVNGSVNVLSPHFISWRKKIHSKETIEKIRKSLLGRKFTDEHRAKLRQAHLGVKLSPSHRLKVIKTLKPIRKGGTYEEAFGIEKANAMKEKMRQAKLGTKMPWNKGFKKEKHPKWIKDRTKIVGRHNRSFHDSDYKQWRKEVLNRDGYKCKMSDVNCKGRLEVHHILVWKDYPELRYQVNNGITLCHAHHPKKRAEEKRLGSHFQKLIT